MPAPEPFASLIRDHERTADVVGAARSAAEAAVQYPDDPSLVPAMLQRLRDLQEFMATDLALHIAKEEQVLFPAYQQLSGDARLIAELTVQHDRVRERDALLRRALEALDHHHDEVEGERARLEVQLNEVSEYVPPALAVEFVETVRRLDWILQGHFTDEEDDLFAPGEALFPAAALVKLAHDMDALEPPTAENPRAHQSRLSRRGKTSPRPNDVRRSLPRFAPNQERGLFASSRYREQFHPPALAATRLDRAI